MAITKTPNYGLNLYGAGTDHLTRARYNADMNAIDNHIKSYRFETGANYVVANNAATVAGAALFPAASVEYGGSASSAELYKAAGRTGTGYTGIQVPAGYSNAIISCFVDFPADATQTGVRRVILHRYRGGVVTILAEQTVLPLGTGDDRVCVAYSGPCAEDDTFYATPFQNSGGNMTLPNANDIGMSIVLI